MDHGEVPPRIDYALTPFGRCLAAALAPLCVWGEQHEARIERAADRRAEAR